MSEQPFLGFWLKRGVKSENYDSLEMMNGGSSELGEGGEFDSKLNELGICNNLNRRLQGSPVKNGKNMKKNSSSESPEKFQNSLLLLRSLEEEEDEEEEEMDRGKEEEGRRKEKGGRRKEEGGENREEEGRRKKKEEEKREKGGREEAEGQWEEESGRSIRSITVVRSEDFLNEYGGGMQSALDLMEKGSSPTGKKEGRRGGGGRRELAVRKKEGRGGRREGVGGSMEGGGGGEGYVALHKYFNMFEEGEVIYRKLLKIEENVFLISVEVDFPDSLAFKMLDFLKEIDVETMEEIMKDWKFKIRVFKKNEDYRFFDEKTLDIQTFDFWLANGYFRSVANFLYFSYSKTFPFYIRTIITENMQNLFTIHNCRLLIKKENGTFNKENINGTFNGTLNGTLNGTCNGTINETFNQEEEYEEKRKRIKRVGGKRAVASESSEPILFEGEIERFKFYNSIRILKRTRVYMEFRMRGERVRVRVNLGEEIKIGLYYPFHGKIENLSFKDPRTKVL